MIAMAHIRQRAGIFQTGGRVTAVILHQGNLTGTRKLSHMGRTGQDDKIILAGYYLGGYYVRGGASMSITVLIHGAVNQGRFLPDSQSEWACTLARLSGKRAVVTVEAETRKRSNNQNKYYHGVVVEILRRYCGYLPDEMHLALREKFLSVVDNRGLKKIRSTTSLTTAEFEEYTASIRTWAATDLGVDIPEPGEVNHEAA